MDKKVWLISVNMGYGHQRTANSLSDLAFEGKVINANDYDGIPQKDRSIWNTTRMGYELISKLKRMPVLGNFVFSLMDYFQRILNFYPKRDLSEPTFQLKQNYNMIGNGWGKHLIEELKIKNKKLGFILPIVSTFFTPAFMADFFDYPGEIFCIVCDADISRAWAPLHPKKSKIKYFAPTRRVAERLEFYGVKKENILLTGYPLPRENIGTENMEILKGDLRHRMPNLDPDQKYYSKYQKLVEENVINLPARINHPLTLTFCVGGAGAQREIGVQILQDLKRKIEKGELRLILVAGIRGKINDYFLQNIEKLNLNGSLGRSIEVIFENDINEYFKKFNSALRETDILWTKPSELSFYSALGIPIIIAPTIGSQEEFNKRWLLKSGFGMLQENPKYAHDWLFDWLKRGYFAEAAMESFIEGKKLGTFIIEKEISKCFGC
ncbi:MAG: hypothetical protein V1756_02110 [Patescibacteria group bacterium]